MHNLTYATSEPLKAKAEGSPGSGVGTEGQEIGQSRPSYLPPDGVVVQLMQRLLRLPPWGRVGMES